jgi:outer membrane protein assembly factor BamD
MKKKSVLFLVLFFALFCLQGCFYHSLFGIKDTPQKRLYKTAEQLVSQGTEAYNDKKYKKALKAFMQLKDWYPFSRYSILAELRIADCNFELEEYDEAIMAYEDFEELHPKNDAIQRVIYRRGLCWYKRIDTVDRDSRPAGKAIVQFNRLKKRFPNSKYVSEIDKMLIECTNNLAGHELYVAEYYYKTGNYKASLNRYKYLVEFFPTSDYAETALDRLGQVQAMVDEKEKKSSKQ